MRGDVKRGLPVEGSLNSQSWRDKALYAEALLEQIGGPEVLEELEDCKGRLAEIAAIAAPDESERMLRIEAKLDRLLKMQAADDGMPHEEEPQV
jgi:hypothetical protein